MGIQALTRFRLSNMNWRSTARSRTIGKLCHRLDADRLFELIDQRGAGHACFAVDEHGAGAADFFEAVGIVGDRRGFFAVAGDGIFGDVAQADDDVHRGAPGEREFFPARGFVWALLALDAEDDLFFCHRSAASSQLNLFRRVVSARARRNLRNVDGLVGQLDFVVDPFGARGF